MIFVQLFLKKILTLGRFCGIIGAGQRPRAADC